MFRVSHVFVVALLLTVVCLGVVHPAAAQQEEEVRGSPSFELSAQDNRVSPGESVNLVISVSNGGEIWNAGPQDMEQRVQTARNTRFEVREGGLHDDITLRSGPVLRGTVPPGITEPISFHLEFDEDIETGRYNVPIDISYDWTRRITRTAGGSEDYHEFSTSERKSVQVVVEDQARFQLVDSESHGVSAGGAGELDLEVENTGTDVARDAVLRVTSGGPGLFFGGLSSPREATRVSLPEMHPGDTEQVSVRVGAEADQSPGSYPVEANVEFRNHAGVDRVSRTLRASVEVRGEQTFTVSDVESGLRVGDEGDLVGNITNEGPDPVDDAVLVFSPQGRNIDPSDTNYALGDVAVGEEKRFRYSVSVSSEAEYGPKQSTFVVRYRNEFDDQREQDVVVDYNVDQSQDEFTLDTDVTLTPGESSRLEVEITNQRDETLEDVQAKIFTDSPLSSNDDEAYVESIAPGETETLVFEISASAGATPKSYSAKMDFRYDDESGDTKISDTYRVPVEVEGGSEGGFPVFTLVLVALLGAAAYVKREPLREAAESWLPVGGD